MILMPSYVNIGARVGADTMVDTWATVGSCAQIGAQRPPVRRRRHRRRARAAAGRAGHRRGRLPDRQPLHGRRGRAGRRGRGPRRGRDPEPGRSRSSTPRPARRSAGASCRRTASRCAAGRKREFPGGEFGCRACSSSSGYEPGERHDTLERRSSATTGVNVGVTDLLALTARARRHPVGQPRRAGHHRPARGASCAAVPWLDARPRRRQPRGPHRRSGATSASSLAGHTDTVPVNGNDRARIEGDALWGLGAADMKGGLAVMLELARTVRRAGGRRHLRLLRRRGGRRRSYNGLGQLFARAARPAGGRRRHPRRADRRACIEAGCQGTMRLRGHAARRAGPHRPAVDGPQRHPPPRRGCSAIVDGYEERRPGDRRLRVPRGAPGGARRGRRGRQRGARRGRASCSTTASRPTARRPRPRRHVRELLAPCARGRRRASRSSTCAVGAAPASTTRCSPRWSTRNGLERPGQARLDRRGPVRRHGIPAANFGPGDPPSPTPRTSASPASQLERTPADVLARPRDRSALTGERRLRRASEPSQHGDDLAVDRDVAGVELHRLQRRVGRHEPHLAALARV